MVLRMKRLFSGLSVLLALSLCLPFGSALQAADAYSQTLLTRDDSPEVQDAAIREAMRRLMTAHSGQPGLWLQPEYQELVTKAPLYVDRFSYPKKFKNPWPRPMAISFDRKRIQPLLGGGSGGNLGGGGTKVLLWLLEGQGGHYSLSAAKTYAGTQGMAAGLGLELLQPMLDLTEQKGFVADQGELEANQSLARLSQRYGTNTQLIGRLQMQGAGVQAEWTLLQGGEARYWGLQGVDEPQVLQQAIVQTATELGITRPAPKAPPPVATGVELVVLGAGQDRSASIEHYLKQQSLILSLQSRGATAEGLRFGLGVLGKTDELREALMISGLLEPTAAPTPKKKAPPRPSFDPLGDFQGNSSSSKPAAPAAPLLYFRLR